MLLLKDGFDDDMKVSIRSRAHGIYNPANYWDNNSTEQ